MFPSPAPPRMRNSILIPRLRLRQFQPCGYKNIRRRNGPRTRTLKLFAPRIVSGRFSYEGIRGEDHPRLCILPGNASRVKTSWSRSARNVTRNLSALSQPIFRWLSTCNLKAQYVAVKVGLADSAKVCRVALNKVWNKLTR